MPNRPRLIIADSESCADLYWATHFFVPDPVLFVETGGKKYLLVSDLEYARARKEATVDQVFSFARYLKPGQPLGEGGLLLALLKELRIRRVAVPASFPVAKADFLRRRGIAVETRPDPFYPARALKTRAEKAAITAALRATEQAIRRGIEVLRQSRIIKSGGGRAKPLHWQGRPLTSERLRGAINGHLMERGYVGRHTIVAGGRQGADPHCVGSGPLYPHQAIVLDVFPRSEATGYHGDITRTVVRGRPPEVLSRMYAAVRAAQQAGIDAIHGGVDASDVHQKVCRVLEAHGFKTERKNGRLQGYIHSTGHGLGLDIHEPPRLSRLPVKLRAGQVVTVEPGLYYEDIGGIRIEDVVFVTRNGCEKLTRLERRFEI